MRRIGESSALSMYDKEPVVQYWVKVVFTDNQEVMVNNAMRHTISDDMEVLEIDTPQEVMIIPLRQLKYFSCDATVFAKK